MFAGESKLKKFNDFVISKDLADTKWREFFQVLNNLVVMKDEFSDLGFVRLEHTLVKVPILVITLENHYTITAVIA